MNILLPPATGYVSGSRASAFVLCILLLAYGATAEDRTLQNDNVEVHVNSADGSYTISAKGDTTPILRSQIAAEIEHHWIESGQYPRHEITNATFEDVLGHGHQVTVKSVGLTGQADLVYTIRVYDDHAFGDIRAWVQNRSGKNLTVQSIRSVAAMGSPTLNLHGRESEARVLSDSFSEDWPPLRIYDLGRAPNGVHRAVGSQLIYNLQSKEDIFFGALTSDRFLTILHLNTQAGANGARVTGLTVDSTGTTEIQATDPESGLRKGPAKNLIELSLPLADGSDLASEALMFAAGTDYHAHLENYGKAIREMHHSRIPEKNMLGWWSWTAYYTRITQGNTFTNALWLAEHLKPLGYNYCHFDLGYGYSRGEYTTPNASQFPHGLLPLTHNISQLGLNVGFWTAPFEVGQRSFVYEHHKDWLVHNREGEPIQITTAEEMRGEGLFVLDTTNPAAQEFLRQTYRTLAREWDAKYIKLDFMDNTAIEGVYYRPNTTALEAERIGLKVIREAVGDTVLLDKDGSPMLNPVGLVDDGRISQDTGHTFERSKEAAPGIAARYYMHRNFFLADPDAFTVSRQVIEERKIQAPLTLNEAQVSIALSAVSGGMYEIGDDLPSLGADADRVALVTNPDLLQMVKLSRAAIPIDLLTYSREDEQPSIFLLHEDARQSIVAVFNWTEEPRSHELSFAEFNLSAGHRYELKDILEPSTSVSAQGDSIHLEQPAHSVRMIKIVDASIPAAAPAVTASIPQQAKISEEIKLSAVAAADGVPALAYHWDFGDGTKEDGRQVSHAFTRAGQYTVQLRVDGIDGVAAREKSSVAVSGTVVLPPPARYQENH